jgi:hypothetical protein
VEAVLTYAAQKICGMSEDEPMNEDELMNKKKLVMQEVLRDVDGAVRRRRSDPQEQYAQGGEHHEAEVMECPVCLAEGMAS